MKAGGTLRSWLKTSRESVSGCSSLSSAKAGVDDDEASADYVAAALLVPRRSLVRELRAGWDFDALRSTHAHAPASTIAARVAQVREASAAIYDGTRLRRRVGPRRAGEVELRDAALASGKPIRIDERTGAWPVDAGPWRRVVVLQADDY